jgi:hypothetical protein
MENKYINGKIYKIISPSNPELVYYGSTINKLCKRMCKHRDDAKRNSEKSTSSKQILDCGDAMIVLVENCPCNSREELIKKEAEYIMNSNCVNKRVPGKPVNHKERYEANKEKMQQKARQYREENEEKIKQYHKIYQQNNQEEIRQKKKEYASKHKDQLREFHQNYFQENKEKLYEYLKDYREKHKEKITCECGGIFSKQGKNRHLLTRRHKNTWMSKVKTLIFNSF